MTEFKRGQVWKCTGEDFPWHTVGKEYTVVAVSPSGQCYVEDDEGDVSRINPRYWELVSEPITLEEYAEELGIEAVYEAVVHNELGLNLDLTEFTEEQLQVLVVMDMLGLKRYKNE